MMKEYRKKDVRLFSGAMALLLTVTCTTMFMPVRAAAAEKNSEAVETYTFTDRQGKTVTVPEDAFAVSVVDFQSGNPWTEQVEEQDPRNAIGLPDNGVQSSFDNICLGKNGSLTLKLGSYIDDGEGDDVYIFEVGEYVESTYVAVSTDCLTWYEIGRVGGGTAGLDIHGKVPSGMNFNYVRMTDTGKNPEGRWPGADIDAVCGLHTSVSAMPGNDKHEKYTPAEGTPEKDILEGNTPGENAFEENITENDKSETGILEKEMPEKEIPKKKLL